MQQPSGLRPPRPEQSALPKVCMDMDSGSTRSLLSARSRCCVCPQSTVFRAEHQSPWSVYSLGADRGHRGPCFLAPWPPSHIPSNSWCICIGVEDFKGLVWLCDCKDSESKPCFRWPCSGILGWALLRSTGWRSKKPPSLRTSVWAQLRNCGLMASLCHSLGPAGSVTLLSSLVPHFLN